MIHRILAAGGALVFAAAALADDRAVIDISGVTFSHGLNQSRNSSPDTIDPGFGYRYVIDGQARGTSGLLQLVFPTARPLAEILETLAPGASEMLQGEVYHPAGTHPVVVVNDHFEGSTVLLGTTVTAAADVTAGIRADNVAEFNLTNVVMLPNSGLIRLGALQITTGTATIDRIPAITGDLNWDGAVNNFDIDAFVLGLTEPGLYLAAFGYDPIFAGDINRDGVLNNFDIDPFVALLTGE